jgi:hypothetical protein
LLRLQALAAKEDVMKHWFLGLALALGFVLMAPAVDVQADSDSGSAGSDSDSKVAVASGGSNGIGVPELDPAVTGSAIVLLLGGVAFMASRRRNDDAA